MSREKSDFCNLETLQPKGNGPVEKLEGYDEHLVFQIGCSDDAFDSGKGTIDDARPFPHAGISEMVNFHRGLNEPMDGFDVFVRDGQRVSTPRFAQNFYDPEGPEDVYSCPVVLVIKVDEEIARKHWYPDLLPAVLPFAPDVNFGKKNVIRLRHELHMYTIFMSASRVNGIPGHRFHHLVF